MLVAWSVVLIAGLATLACIFILTRRIPSPWWRTLLRCLAAVWLLIPAPIQVVQGYYAPAFIVALFEGLFRTGGNPAPALRLLVIASLTVVVVLLVKLAVNTRRERIQSSLAPKDPTVTD
jgi:hypothetical protein